MSSSKAVRGGPIGSTFDFLYDFFRLYSRLYPSNLYDDNYRRLIRAFEDEQLFFISMNYDTLIEQALQTEGYRAQYGLSSRRDDATISVFKPHGSVNWLFPNIAGSTKSVFFGSLQGGNAIASSFGPHRVKQEVMEVSLDELKSIPSELLPPARLPFLEFFNADFIPAMAPPFGNGTKRGHFDLDKVWDSAAQYLCRADELVIIGCSVREQDKALRNLLKENLQDDVEVALVTGDDSVKIRRNLENWLDSPTCSSYGYFNDYLDAIDA